MAHLIGIANQKGGVGKTTTAVNLAACLAASGRRTLVLDLDPQGNATSGLGFDKNALDRSIYHVLLEDMPLDQAARRTGMESLDLVPSEPQLFGADIELVDMEDDREHLLVKALARVRDQYDYIVMDSPPALDFLTINVLTATEKLIVPVQCEYYALEGLTQLVDTVRRVQSYLNPKLHILGVLMTMHDGRTNLARQVVEEVRRHFGERVFETVIHRSVRLSEAPSYGQPIIQYDPRSTGAAAYTEFCQEVTHACEEEGAGPRP
jgi:chromosome partitioning protein